MLATAGLSKSVPCKAGEVRGETSLREVDHIRPIGKSIPVEIHEFQGTREEETDTSANPTQPSTMLWHCTVDVNFPRPDKPSSPSGPWGKTASWTPSFIAAMIS